ncbi:uncharacterized protein [Diabrotica undecimpunctata]|uniref:uncharacterized protein n=1 Tax=Diabrotica undecimpunctata TaxID=50387 RepID=UPI003B639A05
MDELTARSNKKIGKANITRVQTWIRDHLDEVNSKFAITVKLDMLKEAYRDFNEAYKYLEANLIDENLLEMREDTDTVYMECFDILSTKIELLGKSSSNLEAVIPNIAKNISPVAVRLPEFSIQPFSGKITEWDSFFQIFEVTILQNVSLSDIQKLMYLKSYVRGEPAKLISNFPVIAENLQLALDILIERYGNKHILTKTLFLELLDVKTLPHNANHVQLRELYAHVSNKLKALDNLGLTDRNKLDWILISLIEQKLDSATLRALEFSRDRNVEITVESFLCQIQQRSTHLENLAPIRNPDVISSGKNKSSSSFSQNKTNYKVVATGTDAKIFCNFCSLQNHLLFQCKKFKNLSVSERFNFIKTKKLCVNCFGRHFVASCKNKHSCFVCKQKHNTLLHFSSPVGEPTINNSDSPNTLSAGFQEGASMPTALSSTSIDNKVLLGTLSVCVYSKYGRKIIVKALIDPGSQLSFITAGLAKRLQYPAKESNSFITGIGISVARSHRIINIVINSLNNSEKLKMSCGILDQITCQLPQFDIDVKKFSIPSEFVLADRRYYVKSDIELLIGADYCYKLLLEGMHHLGKNMPTLQNSRMGWIVAGTIPNSFVKSPLQKEKHSIHACFESSSQESHHTSEDTAPCVSLREIRKL